MRHLSLGLVPSTHQSGRKCCHGRITKAGNPQCRWLLTQACQHVSLHPGPLGAFYRRLVKRKPRQVAIMALARMVSETVTADLPSETLIASGRSLEWIL